MSVGSYKPFASSLSDKEARYKLKEEMKDVTISNTYYNSLKGIDKFDAVILAAWKYDAANASDVSGQYVAARIRPLKVHGFLLPSPCSLKDPEMQRCVVSLHPIAYSQSPVGTGGGLELAQGDIVSCFWTEKSPQSQGKMSGLRFSFGKVHKDPGNINLECLSALPSAKFGVGQRIGSGGEGTSQHAYSGEMGEIRVTQKEEDYLNRINRMESESTMEWAYKKHQRRGLTHSTLGEGNRYDDLIKKYAAKYGLDPVLWKCLIWSESSFKKNIVSPVGAQGLGQVMPGTARGIARDLGWPRNKYNWKNPEHNLEFSAYYLAEKMNLIAKPIKSTRGTNIKRSLKPRFLAGETRSQVYDAPPVDLLLASYNAGMGNVDKWKGVPPFKETKTYVPKIKRRYFWLKKYGPWKKLPQPPAPPTPTEKVKN